MGVCEIARVGMSLRVRGVGEDGTGGGGRRGRNICSRRTAEGRENSRLFVRTSSGLLTVCLLLNAVRVSEPFSVTVHSTLFTLLKILIQYYDVVSGHFKTKMCKRSTRTILGMFKQISWIKFLLIPVAKHV